MITFKIMQWIIKTNDDDIVFFDTRRKTGAYIIREYVLDNLINEDRVSEIHATLITPDGKWRDIEKFVIVENNDKFLVETKVYDNIRIVGVSSEELSKQTKEDIYNAFIRATKEGTLIYLKRKKK